MSTSALLAGRPSARAVAAIRGGADAERSSRWLGGGGGRAVLALAAAFGAVAFAVGFVVAGSDGPNTDRVIAMTGAGGATRLARSLRDRRRRQLADGARGRGTRASRSGELYQLWLTKAGELAALCGSFLVETDGTTVVPMNAPWRFDDFDGWVVVEEGSKTPVLTT